MKVKTLPTEQQCRELMIKYNNPENIIAHCRKVSETAVFIAKKLQEKGEKINISLLKTAALLHDLDKLETRTPETIENHGELTREILIKEGLPEEIGEVIRNHRAELLLSKEYPNWESKLLVYADTRCDGDKIVSISERIDIVKKRYPHLTQYPELKQRVLKLEQEIFSKLDIKPEDIK